MKCQPTDIEIETVITRIENKDINLQPDFQRGEVWSPSKKKKLIDTVLRNWKIPPIHVVLNSDEVDEVLDGQQRLVAIRDFFDNQFCIDGSIQPCDEKIEELDKLYYRDLSVEMQRKLKKYSITIIRLTEYRPEEPAELFYRLNQPATLTAAEQRNAYIGETRSQIKRLVELFEYAGANKETVGFSNSRLAYDEIISKFVQMVEIGTLRKKITAGDISNRYRNDIVFKSETIENVERVLKRYIDITGSIKDDHYYFPRLSKATLISWLIFIKKKDAESFDVMPEFIYKFEATRDFLKGKISDNIYERYSDFTTALIKKYPFMDAMFNVYNQRASMGSTDALSIIYRDIIMNIYYFMIYDENSKLLIETKNIFEETKNISAVLERLNDSYYWGEVF